MVTTADEFRAGTPYHQNMSQVNECAYVPVALKFGLFVEREAVTNNFILSAAGVASHVSGEIIREDPTEQHFHSQATTIYVQLSDGETATTGDLIYVATDGTGTATLTAGGSAVGQAKLNSRECIIDCEGNKAECVAINIGLLLATPTIPVPPMAVKKKIVSKEVS